LKAALCFSFLVACALLWASAAIAHAVLITSEPQDGATLPASPKDIRLTFGEPVSPLVLRVLEPDGQIVRLNDYRVAANTLFVNLPPQPGAGTVILSWRVVSQDGHPVGGTLSFSVDKTSAEFPKSGEERLVGRLPVWAARFVTLVCLMVAVGTVLFHAWIFPLDPKILWAQTLPMSIVGATAVAVNFALQLADSIGSFQDIGNIGLWFWPVADSFGLASGLAVAALALAIVAGNGGPRTARICSALAFVASGFVFALSGHASTATPQLLMRSAVFLHTLGVLFWIGSLIPLLLLMRGSFSAISAMPTVLARYSRPIVAAVAALVLTGLLLSMVQLSHVEELWGSAYGLVLSAKLLALVPLFGLAAVNRLVLTARVKAGHPGALRWMGRSVAGEVLIGVIIFGIVSLWRLTPPPRSMFVVHVLATGIQFHAHGTQGMANLTISPAHVGPVKVAINVMDIEARPLNVKGVDLALFDPANSLEPIRRTAGRLTSSTWEVDDLTIPVPGLWTFRVDLLLTDFDKVSIKAVLNVPRR
jgi:copper transport protein